MSSETSRSFLKTIVQPLRQETPLWFQVLVVLCLLSFTLQLLTPWLHASNTPPSVESPSDTSSLSIEANGVPLGSLLKKGSQNLQYGEAHIQVIRLWGAIEMEDNNGGPLASLQGGTDAMSVWRALDQATQADTTKGVLLWINSPGGTVGMSQELHERVERLKKVKPVLVLFGDVAASGGYMTACGADYIMAPAGSLTGSIGVIMHSMNMQRLFRDKLGIDPVTIKSGKFKDILSNSRSLTSEERVMLQNMIDTSYQQFLSMVLQGRTQHLKTVAEKNRRMGLIESVADGRVLVATDALRYGLIDEIGTYDDAVEKLRAMIAQREGKPPEAYETLPATESKAGMPWGLSQFLESKLSMSLLQHMLQGVSTPFTMSHPETYYTLKPASVSGTPMARTEGV